MLLQMCVSLTPLAGTNIQVLAAGALKKSNESQHTALAHQRRWSFTLAATPKRHSATSFPFFTQL